MDIWTKKFKPTVIKQKRFQLVLEEIPLPESFNTKPKVVSVVALEPSAEAGKHYHSESDEVFVGLGTVRAVFENLKTKEQISIDLNPDNNEGLLTAVSPPNGVAHKVVNYGTETASIVEIASKHPRKKEIHDYPVK